MSKEKGKDDVKGRESEDEFEERQIDKEEKEINEEKEHRKER